MRIATLLFLLLYPLLSSPQALASRQVIGSGGHQWHVSGGTAISSTAGEAIVSTVQHSETTITQGFQQGRTIGIITFALETEPATCPTSTDGFARITDIAGCAPPYTILWSNGVVGEENNRLSTGNHSVTVQSAHCRGQMVFSIGAGPVSACVLRFFTGLSPNGDGMNDTWVIENVTRPEFAENNVEVFNRWGQPIWSGKNYDNQSVVWDGRTHEGKTLPVGTYYFIANFKGTLHKGFIELTR